jgi:protein O-mannosyl-transferase
MVKNFRRSLIVILLVALPLGLFWRVRNYDFVWDDSLNITENSRLYQVTASKVLYFWQKPYLFLYIPLTYTVWAALARVAEVPGSEESGTKFDPQPFHTVNIVLHVLSVLVVFAILKMLVNSDWAACGGALLFALHPVQVEPVAWVTGLKDVLSGLLSLVAVWQYLVWAKTQTGRKAWHYGVAIGAYGLALLSKPAAVVVPAVSLILDCWVLRRSWRQSAIALIPWVLIAVPVMVVTKWVQPDVQIGFIPPLWARFLVAGDAFAFYLSKLVLPFSLGPDYGRLPESVLQQPLSYVTWIVPCVLAALIWLWRDRKPFLSAAAAIFVVGILPVSGLIPFQFQVISTVADRYLYLSVLGPALALAWLLAAHERSITPVLCVLLLGLLTIASAAQTRFWQDNDTLFNHGLQINSRSWLAHYNLGAVAQTLRGESKEAIEHFRQALQINPNLASAHNNLGLALAAQGQMQAAVEHYREALRINPDHANAHYNLALALAGRGQMAQAVQQYREVLRIDPSDAEAYNKLAVVLATEGQLDESIKYFHKALELTNSAATQSEAHFYLGIASAKQGRLDQAGKHFEEALKLKPDFVDAQYNLGRVLAAQGDLDKAIDYFRLAIRTDPEFAEAHQSLGRALAQQGRKSEAIEHYQIAVQLLKSRRKVSYGR